MGPLLAAISGKRPPGPAFKNEPERATAPYDLSARCVNAQNPACLFVIGPQNFAGLRADQIRLSARKARHLNVSEVTVFGVISRPCLNVVASVGAAVQEGRHDLAVLFSGCARVSKGPGLRCLFRARPTVSRQGIAFDYNSPAELYLSRGRGRHTDYRRFATAAEAIRYAVEELRTRRSISAWMQVEEDRFKKSIGCMTR